MHSAPRRLIGLVVVLGVALCGSPATPHAASPVPVSSDMQRVMAHFHLDLREELVASVSSSSEVGYSPAPAVVVVSGLARFCNRRAIIQHLIRDCVEGRSRLVALLQRYEGQSVPLEAGSTKFHAGRDKPGNFTFDDCAAKLERQAAVDGSRCDYVLGRQWITHTTMEALITAQDGGRSPMCPPRQRRIRPPVNLYRAVVQTLAVGRAYEWARHFTAAAPPRLYVRGRTDFALCVPDVRGKQVPPRTAVVAMAHRDALSPNVMADDRVAQLAPDAAAIYFSAWRVWTHINCSRPCYAGGGEPSAVAIWPANGRLCTGEVPLSMWLSRHGLYPQWDLSLTGYFEGGGRFTPRGATGVKQVQKLSLAMRNRTCARAWPNHLARSVMRPWTCVPRFGSGSDTCARHAAAVAAGNFSTRRCNPVHGVHSMRAAYCPGSMVALADMWAREEGRPQPSTLWRNLPAHVRSCRETSGRGKPYACAVDALPFYSASYAAS